MEGGRNIRSGIVVVRAAATGTSREGTITKRKRMKKASAKLSTFYKKHLTHASLAFDASRPSPGGSAKGTKRHIVSTSLVHLVAEAPGRISREPGEIIVQAFAVHSDRGLFFAEAEEEEEGGGRTEVCSGGGL